jgi:hypothetical protein
VQEGNKNNENNAEVVQKKSPERFDFQNAGLIEGGMGLSRHKEFNYITFLDSNGKKFNELSYTNLGQFFVPYYIDKKKKLFEAIYNNFIVERFNNQEEAQAYVDKLKKGKNKKDEYIIRHEFVYQLTYGMMHEIEYDAARAENITVPETDMKKILPFTVAELVRIGFGWQPQDNKYTIINLYKVTGQDTYTAGIFMEDFAIYTEGAKSEQDAQLIITDWQSGKIQYKVVQGTQLLGKLSGGIAEDKYTEGELNFIRPENVLFEELVNPNSNELLYKKGGYIKTKAKQLQLINDENDEITKEHLHKIEDLGGIWQRRVKLYRTLHKMENGGNVKIEKLHEDTPPPVPTIEDEVRKYANDKNEVSESNLRLVTGSKSLGYPIHTVGTIKLKKQFLKPYYKIIDNII